MKKGNPPVIVTQIFKRTRVAVWDAITDLNQMRQWFYDKIPDFRPEVGFTTQFNMQTLNRDLFHIWKITGMVPLKMIKYCWKYGGYPGEAEVTFDLSQENGSTKLVLTCAVVESFPDDIPEFSRESCTAGWNYLIGERLRALLD